MKRFIMVLLLAGIMLGGCASLKESEFYNHSSHYKNFDHAKYSWWGYKSPDCDYATQSDHEGWWGINVEGPVCE